MKNPSDDTGKIARSAGTVSGAVMCSRILGLVREQVFATLFGAGFTYDAFVLAFRIPNLLRDLFGEGALSAAFVAVFTDYDTNQGSEATWRLANNVIAFFLVVLSAVTILGILFAEPMVRFMAAREGFENIPNKVELAHLLTVIMFPFLVLVSLSSVVMGILNTKGRFFVPAMASSFFNIGSLVGGVSLALILDHYEQPAIVGMAIGTLIGGVLQLIWQLPSLRKLGFIYKFQLDLHSPGLRRILRLMVPALIGLAPLQVNVLVNTYFASSLEQGSLSWLNYAFRLFWLPVGLFGVAMSIAAMPLISKHAALKNIQDLKATYLSSQLMAFCLTIPASIGLIILAEPLVRVIFQHGRFDVYTTVKTAEALSCYALGLFAYTSVKIMVPVFYALNDTKFPVIGSFLAMGANICIIMLTIGDLQHKALALSISGATTLNFLFLATALYRKVEGYSLSYIFRGLGKIIIASFLMGSFVFLMRIFLAPWASRGVTEGLASIGLCIGAGALLYGVALYGMKLQELNIIVDKMRERLKNSPN